MPDEDAASPTRGPLPGGATMYFLTGMHEAPPDRPRLRERLAALQHADTLGEDALFKALRECGGRLFLPAEHGT